MRFIFVEVIIIIGRWQLCVFIYCTVCLYKDICEIIILFIHADYLWLMKEWPFNNDFHNLYQTMLRLQTITLKLGCLSNSLRYTPHVELYLWTYCGKHNDYVHGCHARTTQSDTMTLYDDDDVTTGEVWSSYQVWWNWL